MDLGTLGGKSSEANGINSVGSVVGQSSLPGDGQVRHAFVWHKGDLIDLNSLLPPNSGWELMEANGINDDGYVVGSGSHPGASGAFVLRLPARLRD